MLFFKKMVASAVALAALCGTANASFIANYHPNLSTGNASLFVFGAEGTSGTITNIDGFSQNFTIDNTGVFNLDLGSTPFMTTSGSVNGQSLFVDSADPISGLALNRRNATTDLTVLLDTDALGTDYYAMGFTGRFGEGGQMSVTAIENNTVVTITPSTAMNGHAAGVPFNITLQAGESVKYNTASLGDVTGSHIQSTKPVAVFSGAACTQVPDGLVACDHLISQQFSTDNYDNSFVITENFGGGTDSDLVRVMAATDGTEVFVNGVSQGTINAGESIEIDKIGNAIITASEPVTVGQFIRGQGGTRTTGDPAMAMVPGVSQWLDSYVYATPVDSEAFDQNFLNIAIETSALASLLLNGLAVDTSGFTTIGSYSVGTLAIAAGIGNISASQTFLAMVAGFSNFDSYFSAIATGFSTGVSPPPPPTNEVPIPAAFPLMLGGLAGLRWLTGRKKKVA